MPEAEPSAYLDEWAHARTIEIPTTGEPLVYEKPDLDAFIARGFVPNPLYPLAVKVERGISSEFEEGLSLEDRKAYRDLRCLVIAQHLRSPNLVQEHGLAEAVRIVDEVMPAHYRDVLWAHSVHIIDPAKEMRTLLEQLPFRRRETGPDAASGGGDLGTEAE